MYLLLGDVPDTLWQSHQHCHCPLAMVTWIEPNFVIADCNGEKQKSPVLTVCRGQCCGPVQGAVGGQIWWCGLGGNVSEAVWHWQVDVQEDQDYSLPHLLFHDVLGACLSPFLS